MSDGLNDPTTPAELRAALRRARRQQETPLKAIAAKVGVTHQAIAQYESGATRPRPDRLRKWLRSLGLPEDWAHLYSDWRALDQIEAALSAKGVPESDRSVVLRVTETVLRDARKK